MSTRGAVAIRQGKKWTGVYNHYDSYPTGLGKEVWDYLHQDTLSLKQFAHDLLQYDDWRNYCGAGICEYCGKVSKGQPCNISGVIFARESQFTTKDEMRAYYHGLTAWQGRDQEIERQINNEWAIRSNIERTGFPDPDCLYHSHGKLEDKVTNDNCDPLFIEWVYVIDPQLNTIEILCNARAKGTHKETSCDGLREWQQPNYKHHAIALYPLQGNEPDWTWLEKQANLISDNAYNAFEPKEESKCQS